MTTLVVVPCSRHYNHMGTRPCQVGRARCDAALQVARQARKGGKYDEVMFALGAGREASRELGNTLAECSYRYLRDKAPEFHYLVNKGHTNAVTTLSELRWVFAEVLQRCGPDVEFWIVTSPRHDRRVRLIMHWFFPEFAAQTQVFPAENTPPISFVTEAVGYAKLGAVRLFGEDAIERVVYAVRKPQYRD